MCIFQVNKFIKRKPEMVENEEDIKRQHPYGPSNFGWTSSAALIAVGGAQKL